MQIGFYIGTLLYQHDCVVIPGFGGFIANYTPASIHPVQHTFIPPSRQIMFNSGLIHNDGLLATHIAQEEGISFHLALNRIAEETDVILAELKAGKSIILGDFGSLRSNQERNIVFTPKLANNYLEDAYGLSTFVSPAIRRNGYQSNQDSKDKNIGIHLPAAVRRIAAVAIPLLAIGLWSLFNTDRITSFTSNYSSIFPTEIVSQFRASSIKNSIPVYVLSHSRSTVNKSQPAPEMTKVETPTVEALPAVTKTVAKEEKANLNKPVSPSPAVEVKSSESAHFLIIGGAFKVKENADKLVKQLLAKNLDATIAGQNKKGLYLVSAASCDDASQATLKLKELLDKGIESAWILKK
jgi:cell division septation protein DedD